MTTIPGGWSIEYDPKPIPMRNYDWNYCHEDFDGPDDPRCGTARDFASCLIAIRELEEDTREPAKPLEGT